MIESILCWNCRGAKSDGFVRELKELNRLHQPTNITIVEPKISGVEANTICRKLGKSHWLRSEASGFSGGVWVLWNEEEIKLVPRAVHRSFVHAEVVSEGGKCWDLVAVYASPNPGVRKSLWNSLSNLAITRPWVIIGDFNCVLSSEERSPEGRTSSSFINWVEQMNLIDLGFEGPRFTWHHGVSMENRRPARLDRSLCDTGWRSLFPSAHVKHLIHSHSDHCPILLNLEEGGGAV